MTAADYSRELGLAKQLVEELRTQHVSWTATGQRFEAWRNKVINLIRCVYSNTSPQEKQFEGASSSDTIPVSYMGKDLRNDQRLQSAFARTLPRAEAYMEALVQDLEVRAPTTEQGTHSRPKVFIAHGGESPALKKLEDFLQALGCEPVVAERQPSADRSVNQQVEWCLSISHCAIVLATAENLKEEKLYSRPNVYIELGRFQERFPGKTIYLLEDGAKFPTNINEKVWERFTNKNMEQAFRKIVIELHAFGFLKAEVPSKRVN